MDKVLIQEKPSIRNLIFRKPRSARTIEIVAFLAGLLLLLQIEGGYTTRFKVFAFVLAFAVITIRPFIYRMVIRPQYTLTEKALIINKGARQESYALGIIEPTHDLPFIYRIGGKKQELMISDEFVTILNEQLDKIKKLNKRK